MKDSFKKKQYNSFKRYIIRIMIITIILCISIMPLDIRAADRPIYKERHGNFYYRTVDPDTIDGYIGTNKDVVIPIMNDGWIGVASLGQNENIRNITLNAKVNKVGEGAFSTCRNLENIFVDPDNPYFSSIDGVLFDKEGTTLIAYPQNRGQKEYHIPEGTKYISPYAFIIKRGFLDFRTLLWKIYLPDSLLEVSGFTFFKCRTIRVIYIKDTNERYLIRNGIVFDKDIEEIVYYPAIKANYYFVPEGIRTIGYRAFFYSGLRYIRFNEDITKIGEGAFLDCRLRNVIIPDKVASIEQYAFSRNKIKKLRLGKAIENIGDQAFSTNNITELELNDSLVYIGEYAFAWNDIKGTLVFPKSLEFIGQSAFTSEEVLKVIIWEGVHIVGNLFGSEEFQKAYDEHGAGTYIRTDEGKWIKE
jgi:hypothetical protein